MRRAHGFTWTIADFDHVTPSDIYGDVLVARARQDPRIVALTADLGKTTKLLRFAEAFPARFFNVGIAEQNLMAVAAGLAATGLVPVASTYAAFASLRAAEFVRTDIGYNRRNVKIIATMAGTSFGTGGPTHHALEDIALMRAIPGLVVLAPADGLETGKALDAALAHEGPVYLRTGRGMEAPVYRDDQFPFTIGKASELRAGGDATVIACGATVLGAVRASDRFRQRGLSVRVLNMHTLKPLDDEAILRAMVETGRVVTVEDHSVINGLGSAVADVIASSGRGCALRKLGHQDRFAELGYPEDLLYRNGLDEDGVIAALASMTGVAMPSDEQWDDGP